MNDHSQSTDDGALEQDGAAMWLRLIEGSTPADMARGFATLFGSDLRWDADAADGRWLIWNGRYWAQGTRKWEPLHQMLTRMSQDLKQCAWRAQKDMDKSASWVKGTKDQTDGQAVAAMLDARRKLLSTHRAQRDILMQVSSMEGVLARAGDFDQHPDLLNFRNCTVDLTTGQQRPHRKEDMLTTCVPYCYDPSAQCPRYLDAVWRMTGRNFDVYCFVLKALGYSLLSGNREQLIFFIDGDSGSGKSLVLETAGTVLGAAMWHPAEARLVTREEQHDSVRKALRGKRLVTIDETSETMTLNEAALKSLTGASHLATRAQFGEQENTPVTWSIWVSTNEMPNVMNLDGAVRRRLVVIPGGPGVPEAERVAGLGAQIAAQEAEGILALLVKGAAEYHRSGLARPADVELRTESYVQDHDLVARFLAECCAPAPGTSVPMPMLHQHYMSWSRTWYKTDPMGRNTFYDAVRGKGYEVVSRTFAGLRILAPGESPAAR